jgi:hypothetical protein
MDLVVTRHQADCILQQIRSFVTRNKRSPDKNELLYFYQESEELAEAVVCL